MNNYSKYINKNVFNKYLSTREMFDSYNNNYNYQMEINNLYTGIKKLVY